MRYEKGEHYILTRPGPGAWNFQRQWPLGVTFQAETPEGIKVSADGRLAFLQLLVDTAANRIQMFAPKYLYDTVSDSQKFTDKAQALLIFGAAQPPAVELNGKACAGPFKTVEIAGVKAWVVPLYDFTADAVLPGIAERYQAAMGKLPKP